MIHLTTSAAKNRLRILWLAVSFAGWLALTASGFAQTPGGDGIGPFRSQTIQLDAGWNAVYLEIEPRISNPNELFVGTPIEIVAAYNRPVTAMEFIESPSQVLPDRKSWNVWYAPERDDAPLANLGAIQAHQAYLVFTERAFTWSLEGTAYFGSARWHPNAFSLVGFPIDPAEQPTIANFFAGAAPHSPLKVYRMANGQWNLVTHPQQELMKPGTAYWIHSRGASKFGGPLEVSFPGSAAGGLVFSEDTGARRVEIRNASPFPQQLTVSLQGGSTGQLTLAHAVRVINGPEDAIVEYSARMTQGMQIGPLEPGDAFHLDLEVVQSLVSAPVMTTTLTLHSSAGPRIEIPIVSLRRDLAQAP